MFENKEVNRFANYLDSISTDLRSDNSPAREYLIKISDEYKDNPELGLSKIEEIEKTENFTKQEIEKLVSEFIKYKYSEPLINTSHRKEDNETSEICGRIRIGTFDQDTYELLKDLDQDFLKKLYSHLGGNPYHLE